MIEINYDNLFRTGGRFYTYLTKEEFEKYLEEGDLYELEDLEALKTYTFFRVCKSDDGEFLFMKITAELIDMNCSMMFFMHSPGKGKTMVLQGYKEHWFFIPGEV